MRWRQPASPGTDFFGLERFRWAGTQALAAGKHTLVLFDFTYDGPGPAKGGTGVLKVDGTEVANRKIPHTIPFFLTIDETLDICVDTRTPVDDQDYQVPFHFNGQIGQVTFKLGPEQLTGADQQAKQDALANRAARESKGERCQPKLAPPTKC